MRYINKKIFRCIFFNLWPYHRLGIELYTLGHPETCRNNYVLFSVTVKIKTFSTFSKWEEIHCSNGIKSYYSIISKLAMCYNHIHITLFRFHAIVFYLSKCVLRCGVLNTKVFSIPWDAPHRTASDTHQLANCIDSRFGDTCMVKFNVHSGAIHSTHWRAELDVMGSISTWE